MDFAKKQLEKYGWKSGKGLGKQENGITEAIKPKLKRSVTGIGHDAAAEFTEHWWKTLYDKASQNVEIQEENGVPKRFKAKEEFEITNSTWKLGRKNKSQQSQNPEYFDNFVKKAVLTSGATKLENMSSESDDEEDLKEKKDVSNITDEELFAACGGRTAHKGARHGLKATGKLARIEQQEQSLLNDSKFSAYTKKTPKLKNNNPQMEELFLNSDLEKINSKEKKKKYCTKSNDNATTDLRNANIVDIEYEPQEMILDSKKSKKSKNNDTNILDNKKSKKSKYNDIDTDSKMEERAKISDTDNKDETAGLSGSKKKKKHCKNDMDTESISDIKEIESNNLRANRSDITDNHETETAVSRKKKKHFKVKKDNSSKCYKISTSNDNETETAGLSKKRKQNNGLNISLNGCGNDDIETAKSNKKKRKSNLNEDINDL